MNLQEIATASAIAIYSPCTWLLKFLISFRPENLAAGNMPLSTAANCKVMVKPIAVVCVASPSTQLIGHHEIHGIYSENEKKDD